MNAKEKYDSLNLKSAWAYTKQKADYNDLYFSSMLFNDIKEIDKTNVELFFTNNYEKYGISTNRHRILAIAQMFGLITKSLFYSRGGSPYAHESVTPVFFSLNNYAPGTSGFNKVMSEQLIKIRVKSIIDTTNYRDGYKVFPFLFLFLVMWKLDKEHAIKLVPMKKIWTYVLTCSSMSQIDDAVSWLCDPSSLISPYVSQYKSDSRFMTLFFECTKMFSLDHDLLSLNHPIADEFYEKIISNLDFIKLEEYLTDDAKYKEYLENPQFFDFDLTNNDTSIIRRSHNQVHQTFRRRDELQEIGQNEVSIIVPEKDNVSVEKALDVLLDMQEEHDVRLANPYENETEIIRSNNRIPSLKNGLETNNRYSTDPRLGKTVIKKASYTCELSGVIGGNHSTFKSARGAKYLEAHHLVPMKAQKDYVCLGINLDRTENIVALCPNCHKAVHYGTKEEKVRYLKPLYLKRIDKLESLGIDISFDVLLDEYY